MSRHFLQIPGPTNVPDRILKAMASPTIDHRSEEFAALSKDVQVRLGALAGCAERVFIYPASGTGAWEAALVNTLSPGDRVLMYETGHFSTLWCDLASRLGLDPVLLPGDWRSGVDAQAIEAALRADTAGAIRAVCVVHNETSTGCSSLISEVRRAIDAVDHPALLMVDTISSLGSIAYDHDGWGVDVTVGCSQKGLMLPPGLSFTMASRKALARSETAGFARGYWSWGSMTGTAETGYFPYTPPTNLLFGLREALDMFDEIGFDAVLARHAHHAAATRVAVEAWGLETVCNAPRNYSNSLTAVMMPQGRSADAFRKTVLERFNMSLGSGLSRLADKVFRIGHLGDFSDLMLAGTLSGVQMGLRLEGMAVGDGVQAALDVLERNPDNGTPIPAQSRA